LPRTIKLTGDLISCINGKLLILSTAFLAVCFFVRCGKNKSDSENRTHSEVRFKKFPKDSLFTQAIKFVNLQKDTVRLRQFLPKYSPDDKKNQDDTRRKLYALKDIGNYYSGKQIGDSAILYYRAGIGLALNKKEYLNELTELFRGLAALYVRHANFVDGLDFYGRAMDAAKKAGNEELFCNCMAGAGSTYGQMGQEEEAMKCFLQIKAYAEKNKNDALLNRSLNSLGDIFRRQGYLDTAIYFHEQALAEHYKNTGNKNDFWACTSLGKIYARKNNCNKAREYFNVILTHTESNRLYNLSSQVYLNLASCDEKEGNRTAAIQKGLKAYELNTIIPDLLLQAAISERLSHLYENSGQFEKSLHYYKLFKTLTDTIKNEQQVRMLAELKFKQQEEKLLNKMEKSVRLLHMEKKNRQLESRRHMNIIIATCVVILLTLVYGIFILRSLRRNKKQSRIIQLQKEDILNSIQYAKRIQHAMLPDRGEISEALTKHFVLFKPKDIVSGDFYFFRKHQQHVFIAAADCTGHGVPGALMSMIGLEKLHDAVSQSQDVSEILRLVNKGIKFTLGQSGQLELTRDGMDIALCDINLENNSVKYAAANIPMWVIREGKTSVEEFQATKRAIGGFTDSDQHFESHEINLKKGDTFYICSDGYADTFSKDSKKLTRKRFKEILIGIQHLSMPEQELYLNDFIENWKADAEQIDDILVIGVRF
jgi:serine phosphatase RsbU (regulator of sigma subunit)